MTRALYASFRPSPEVLRGLLFSTNLVSKSRMLSVRAVYVLRPLDLAGLLPNHFIRILVFPESEKHRLTETVIPRPLRESDLAEPSLLRLRLRIGILDGVGFMSARAALAYVELPEKMPLPPPEPRLAYHEFPISVREVPSSFPMSGR
jgi:hypothetical protein